MTELPRVILVHLQEQAGQRLSDLQRILKIEFPDATLSIIMGYDKFDEHTYVKAAYFIVSVINFQTDLYIRILFFI